MPAYVKPNIGKLVLIFWRGSEEVERQLAASGTTAVSTAMKMLSMKEELQPGDRLTVHANDNHGEEASPPPRSGPSPADAPA